MVRWPECMVLPPWSVFPFLCCPSLCPLLPFQTSRPLYFFFPSFNALARLWSPFLFFSNTSGWRKTPALTWIPLPLLFSTPFFLLFSCFRYNHFFLFPFLQIARYIAVLSFHVLEIRKQRQLQTFFPSFLLSRLYFCLFPSLNAFP